MTEELNFQKTEKLDNLLPSSSPDAWVTEENPNMDINCSLKESVQFFKKANKELLMEPKDYEVYKAFPETLTVYRGVAVGRIEKGLSWTANKETAEWFAHRFDNENEKGYVQSMTVSKKDILAYFNTRGEDEIVINIFAKRC